MKSKIARGCLALAVVIFFSGFFVLCACPEFYAAAAIFAGVATWMSTGRPRLWAIVILVASLILTVWEIYSE
jgi:hypothetical protein